MQIKDLKPGDRALIKNVVVEKIDTLIAVFDVCHFNENFHCKPLKHNQDTFDHLKIGQLFRHEDVDGPDECVYMKIGNVCGYNSVVIQRNTNAWGPGTLRNFEDDCILEKVESCTTKGNVN